MIMISYEANVKNVARHKKWPTLSCGHAYMHFKQVKTSELKITAHHALFPVIIMQKSAR